MKKYFVYIDGKQSEPLSLVELKELSINKNTLVWYKGLTNWEEAGKLDELNELWQTIDEIQDTDYEEPRNYSNYWFLGICLIILIGWYVLETSNESQNNSIKKGLIIDSTSSGKKNNTSLEKGCFYNDLSKKFNYQIMRNLDGDIFILTVIISEKLTSKKVDVVNFTSTDFLYGSVFESCDNIRSFSTNKNINKDVIDGDWGDFVVADFNSDNKDDFAIKYKTGGNAGPLYNFYIQDLNGKFSRDREHIGIEYRLNLKTY